MPGVFSPRGGQFPNLTAAGLFEKNNEDEVIANVNDDLPTPAVLAQCDNLPVYDASGTAVSFGSLYKDKGKGKQGDDAPAKVLIIFIRHFYCGVSTTPVYH